MVLPETSRRLATFRRKIEAPERLFFGIGLFRRPPERFVRPKTAAA
jgi:hypothetical protein